MLEGYQGKILWVDVSTGQVSIEPFREPFARRYLGGNGFAARVLFDRLPTWLDPFDPRNLVVFAVGPLTDTSVPGNSRVCVASKSPLTGLFFDSTFGGQFPITLKRTGFDAVVIAGRAPRPSYLLVTEAGVEVKSAEKLWGLPTKQAVEAIQELEGPETDVTAIGPAGEHRVRYACLAHYWKNREAIGGRGGIAAVLGAKQLKAVAVRGSQKTRVADAARLRELVTARREDLTKGTQALKTYGTAFLVQPVNALGALGARNQGREWTDVARSLSGELYKEQYWVKDTTCQKCPVACGKTVKVPDGPYEGLRWKIPEFETLYALGTMNEVWDPGAMVRGEELCDQLGLDTISMGVSISFLLACAEAGLIRAEEVGIPLRFGEPEAILRLIERTAYRQGVGDLLAEGSARMAERFGPESRRLIYCVKGLELPAHSARALKGMSIGYATATRGGSHHDTRPTPQYAQGFDRRSPDGKPAFAIRSQHFTAVGDSLVLCRFTAERGLGLFLNEAYAQALAAATGWDLSVEELERIGERIVNLERCFNVREGVRREHDTLPHKVLAEPIPDGPSKGAYCPPEELNAMLDEYYRLRGWTPEGIPSAQKLRELGLPAP
jgi:aldehyde:ferredoxin oxidoreductase